MATIALVARAEDHPAQVAQVSAQAALPRWDAAIAPAVPQTHSASSRDDDDAAPQTWWRLPSRNLAKTRSSKQETIRT